MPLDAVTPSGRIVRRMPWAGYNAVIIAAREAPPRLPQGWGGSFGRPLFRPNDRPQQEAVGVAPAPRRTLNTLAPHITGKHQRERVLSLLRLIGSSGLALPSIGEMARLLNAEDSSISGTLIWLGKQGIIRRWAGMGEFAGQRAIKLVDSDVILRTSLAPDTLSFAP